jgi:hypothetical protein
MEQSSNNAQPSVDNQKASSSNDNVRIKYRVIGKNKNTEIGIDDLRESIQKVKDKHLKEIREKSGNYKMWSPLEQFDYKLKEKDSSDDLNQKLLILECSICNEEVMCSDRSHSYQNYFKAHTTRAYHIKFLEQEALKAAKAQKHSNKQINLKFLKDWDKVKDTIDEKAKDKRKFFFHNTTSDIVTCSDCSTKAREFTIANINLDPEGFRKLFDNHLEAPDHKDNSIKAQNNLHSYFRNSGISSSGKQNDSQNFCLNCLNVSSHHQVLQG